MKKKDNDDISRKKMAAVMAAITACINSSEESSGYARIIRPSIWTTASREAEMRKRTMVQMRSHGRTAYI